MLFNIVIIATIAVVSGLQHAIGWQFCFTIVTLACDNQCSDHFQPVTVTCPTLPGTVTKAVDAVSVARSLLAMPVTGT